MMDKKLTDGLLVLIAAVLLPLAIVTASTVGASFLPENQAGAYIIEGAEYLEEGQIREAMKEFNKAIEIYPENPQAYYIRGAAHNQLGHFGLAKDDLTKAIAMGVDSIHWAYFDRGLAYSLTGNTSRALIDLNEAIEIKPDFAEAYALRGAVYFDRGQVEAAISDLEKALEFDLEPENEAVIENMLEEFRPE